MHAHAQVDELCTELVQRLDMKASYGALQPPDLADCAWALASTGYK